MVKQVLLEQIIQSGVPQDMAQTLLPQLNHWLASLPAIECWQHITQQLLKPNDPFPFHLLLYETTFADWDFHQGYPPAWIPSAEQIQATNIAACRVARLVNLRSPCLLAHDDATVGDSLSTTLYRSR
jgi:acetyl-CoA synthetase